MPGVAELHILLHGTGSFFTSAIEHIHVANVGDKYNLYSASNIFYNMRQIDFAIGNKFSFCNLRQIHLAI